jgi:hypothetical protein
MAAASKLSIACNLPHGVHLQLYKMADTPQGRMAAPVGDRVTIAGANHPEAVAGYGLTEDVDASWFTEWLAQNKDSPLIGTMIVREKAADAKAAGKDQKGKKMGFEPMNPADMPKELDVIDPKA